MRRFDWVAVTGLILGCLHGSGAAADSFADGIYTPRGGLYLAGTFGYTFEYEIDSNDFAMGSDIAVFDFDEAFAYTAAVGAYLGQVRVELETGWREPDVLKSNPPALGEEVDGDLSYLTFMGNVYYDFPLGSDAVMWYLGAGAGVAITFGDIDFDPPTTVSDGFTTVVTDVYDDTNSTFAYQFMTGFSFELIDNFILTTGYRIRLFSEFDDPNSLLVFRDHEVHALEVGLRIDF